MTEPTRHDRLRPVELLAMSGIFGVFTGLIVLMSTRQFTLAGIFTGIAFIVGVVVLAMLSLSAKPSDAERREVRDENGRIKGILEDRDDNYPKGH